MQWSVIPWHQGGTVAENEDCVAPFPPHKAVNNIPRSESVCATIKRTMASLQSHTLCTTVDVQELPLFHS